MAEVLMDAVRDGRDLMERDAMLPSWAALTPAEQEAAVEAFGASILKSLPRLCEAEPEHPNYRYQRTGDESV